jgi:hypothetical protein
MIRKILLVCGILSTVLYIGTDIALSMSLEGYRYADQAISELSAIGAPTTPLWVAMQFLYNPLLIAFGIGVWLSAGGKRSLRVTGIFLAVWGIIGFLWLLFPMSQRGVGERSFNDLMHLVMSGITVLLIILFIGFGSGARGKGFRIYSILTILAMLVFGALMSPQAAQIDAGSTPWMGVYERVMIYVYLIWMIVLAIVLGRVSGTY